jgi:hypothetical protein
MYAHSPLPSPTLAPFLWGQCSYLVFISRPLTLKCWKCCTPYHRQFPKLYTVHVGGRFLGCLQTCQQGNCSIFCPSKNLVSVTVNGTTRIIEHCVCISNNHISKKAKYPFSSNSTLFTNRMFQKMSHEYRVGQ